MNDRKIAFIICVNNQIYFEECERYIRRLKIPKGCEVEVIGIREADSMCAAYNLGMRSSSARYKIYMHQDVFIRDTSFLFRILDIFGRDEAIGMIGMVGGIGMPKTGVTYLAWNVGIVDCREPDMAYHLLCDPSGQKDAVVDAIDGLLMATRYDVPWREDLFRDFDFYDVSQSFEMRRCGYKIIVPYQETLWVIHDSGFAKLGNYDRNRRICLGEYPEFFTEGNGFTFTYQKEWELLGDQSAGQVKQLLNMGEWESVAEIIRGYRDNKMKNSRLETFGIMSDIYQEEKSRQGGCGFFDGVGGYEEIYGRYQAVRFLLRRMEVGMPEEEYQELIDAIRVGRISCEAMTVMVLHSVLEKAPVLRLLEGYYRESGQSRCADRMLEIYRMVNGKPLPVAYSK